MKRCTTCILPDSVPGITFDTQGVCVFCRSYRKPTTLGASALHAIVEEARNAEGPYDCIVPLSGGRDSAYVLYVARKQLGLRVLAVNYDNEFRTDQAITNMTNACKALDVELREVRSRKDLATKVTRYKMLCSDMTRLYGVCRACTYGHRSAVYRVAHEHRVPLIFWGTSEQEETHRLLYVPKRLLRRRESRAAKFLNPDYYRYEHYFLQLRKELPMPCRRFPGKSTRLSCGHVRELSIFDYIPWDRRKIKTTIMEQLGWRKPAGSPSSWHTDCELTRVVSHCFFKLYGCSKHCFGYCLMINDGQVTREEALRAEEELMTSHGNTRDLERLLREKIGLSERDADTIVSAEPPVPAISERLTGRAP